MIVYLPGAILFSAEDELSLRPEGVREAIRRLGLTMFVEIIAAPGIAPYSGGGWYVREQHQHEIALDPQLSPEERSRTLWHELLHAAQNEQNLPYDEAAAQEAESLHEEVPLCVS